MKIKPIQILGMIILVGLFLSSCSIITGKGNDMKLFTSIENGSLEGAKEAIDDGANLNELSGFLLTKITQFGVRQKNPFRIACEDGRDSIARYLIEKGADPNYTDSAGVSQLMYAAGMGNNELCELLLKHGAKINQTGKDGYTALDFMLQWGPLEQYSNLTFNMLIKNGAKITPKTLESILRNSIGYCKYGMIKQILQGLINAGFKSNLDPVFEAAILGESSKVAEYVLKGKVKKDYEKKIVLYSTAFCNLKTVKLLENRGLEIRLFDDNKNSTLAIAAKYGQLETLKYLLAKFKGTENENNDNETALILSVRNNQYETAKYLLKKGARTYYEHNGYQVSAMNFASANGDVRIIKLLIENGYPRNAKNIIPAMIEAIKWDQLNSLKYFLDLGIDLDIEDQNGTTLLGEACTLGKMNFVKLLVESGANVDGSGLKGLPLNLASQFCRTNIAEYLIKKGVDVNAIGVWDDGSKTNSALVEAIQSGAFDIVKLLVENGADLEYIDSDDSIKSIRTFAIQRGSKHIAEYLSKKGAK
ncbi:MAG: ankyrin repeat domain-containing protein [Clostridia bacterium]|jgi:ankyrin repeat protein